MPLKHTTSYKYLDFFFNENMSFTEVGKAWAELEEEHSLFQPFRNFELQECRILRMPQTVMLSRVEP